MIAGRETIARLALNPRFLPGIIGLISLAIAALLLPLIHTTTFVGYADPAAYGGVADNILRGRGPTQDFIDFFFRPYPAISHRTEHWFTLFTLLLTPSLALFGKTAFAVKLPVLLSYLLLPLAAFAVARRLAGNVVAFLAALFMAIHPYVLEWSINGWPDIPFTLLSLATIRLYLGRRDESSPAAGLGLSLGLLCWFRASGFLVLGGLLLDAVLERRFTLFRRRGFWWAAAAFVVGFSPAILLAPPGSPGLLSGSHGVLAATMGYFGNPQEEHWQVFWDNVPSLRGTLRQAGPGVILAKAARELTGLVIQRNYFEPNPPLLQLVTLPLILLGLWSLLRSPREHSHRLILSLVGCTLVGLAVLFKMNSRYLFLVQFLLVAAGFEGFQRLWSGIADSLQGELAVVPESWKRLLPILPGVLLSACLLGPELVEFAGKFGRADANYPFTDEYALLADFEQVSRAIPAGEAVMNTLPWSFTFHTGRPSVMIPYGSVNEILAICQRYRVSYLVDFSGSGEEFLADYQEFVPVGSFHRAVLFRLDRGRGRGVGLYYQRNDRPLFEWRIDRSAKGRDEVFP